ncbi:MAG: hypothetical protein ACK58T_40210 [Phycisphaerae bacterium]
MHDRAKLGRAARVPWRGVDHRPMNAGLIGGELRTQWLQLRPSCGPTSASRTR